MTLNDMEHKKRQHFLAKVLMPSGSWLGTFWSFASKTKKQKLLIGCYRILTIQRGFRSCGNKKTPHHTFRDMLRPSARVCSLTYTTNQTKNAILCVVLIVDPIVWRIHQSPFFGILGVCMCGPEEDLAQGGRFP